MKNRRKTIMAFMLVACLIMGLGYAALTDVLDITGTADISQANAQLGFDDDIYFIEAKANNTTGTIPDTVSINTNNNDKASFTSKNLQTKGDTASFTFTIKNDNDVAALITPKLSENTQTDYFDIYSDWDAESKTIDAGGTLTYTVTVELKQTPILENDTLLSGSFNIELTATAVESTTGATN